jgi:transcription elongation factor Elf1
LISAVNNERRIHGTNEEGGTIVRGWIDNLIQYNQNGNNGCCPFCDSSDVDVAKTDFGRKSITFKCLKCGKEEHFDGVSLVTEI